MGQASGKSGQASSDEKKGIATGLEAYGISEQGSIDAAASTSRWLWDTCRWFETSDDTDPVKICTYCCEDFKPRKVKAPLVLTWLALQIMGILYQWCLYWEIGTHLSDYEEMLATNCGSEHQQHGVCLGPSWNLSYSGLLTFPPTAGDDSTADFDFVIPADQAFNFDTLSSPPTFLLGIEPQDPHSKSRWKLSISAVNSYTGNFIAPVYGMGSKYQVLTDKRKNMQTGSSSQVAWRGSLSMTSKYSDHAQIHIYIVDSRIQHLEDVHSQEQCSFEESWQNFNSRQNGTHHKVLTYAYSFTQLFLVMSVLCTGIVLHRFYFYVEGGKLVSRIIAVKFVVQDFPQQMCIVAYLYGWYAENGMRCQMCLFHPQHCDQEHPLHFSNAMVCLFTLLSASSNQLMMQAKVRRYDDEEEFFLWFVRAAIFSVTVLPFSTAIFVLSRSLLHLRSVFIYFVAGVPTLLGWGTLFCVPMFTICDEDNF